MPQFETVAISPYSQYTVPNQIYTSRTTNQVAVDDDWVRDTSESYELFNLQETRAFGSDRKIIAHMELDTGPL